MMNNLQSSAFVAKTTQLLSSVARLRLLLVMLLTLTASTAWGAIDANSTWTETAWTSIKDGATFIIANNCDIAMYNGNGTSAPSQISIDYDTNTKKITVNTNGKSHDDIAWIFSGSSSAATIKSYNNQSNHLYTTNTNNGLKVGTTSCTYSMGSMGRLLKASTFKRYVGTYSTSDWRSYTTENAGNYGSSCSNQTLTFYVLDEVVSNTPTITVTPSTVSFGKVNLGESVTSTFVVKGSNLTGNITLSGSSAPITLSSSTITKAEAESTNGKTITVTFSPTTTTNISKTITLTSSGAESKTVTVTGQGQQVYPVHYYVNGTEITALKEVVVAGGKVSALPDENDVSSCDNVNYPYFIGWSTANFGKSTTEPTTLVDGTEVINVETNYYAVFAKGTGGGNTTKTYDFESAAQTPWQNSFTTLKDSQGYNSSKAGSITGNGQVTYNAKVPVTSFSFSIKRASSNTNGTVYVERSTNGTSWTQCTSYGISSFGNGSFTTMTYSSFDGNEYYVRVRYASSGNAQRYIDNVSITYGGGIQHTEWITSCSTQTVVSLIPKITFLVQAKFTHFLR